jgi:hypothetical protein
MAAHKNKISAGTTAGLIGLAAATVAGAYYLYGSKDATKNRKKIKGWTLRAKGEVLEKLETMKEVNEDAYRKVVDTVAEKYKKMKNIDTTELNALVSDLKRHWSNIKRQVQGVKKSKRPKSAK